MTLTAVLPLTAAQESSLLARYRATAPANFHHATTSLTLAASRRRWALLFISATVVLVQLTVAISVANGVDAGACVESSDCVRGYYCATSSAKCEQCESPGYCGTNRTAEQWAIQAGHRQPTDFASHCAACSTATAFGGDTYDYTTHLIAARHRMQSRRLGDHLTLVFASFFVSLALANEMRDVQLCALMRRERREVMNDHGRCSWHVAVLWTIEALRRYGVLTFVSGAVMQLAIFRGADSLSVCLNAVAVLFLLEIDEMLYAHGTSGAFRLSSEEHARPAVGPDDERAMVWSKSAIVLAVSAGTPLGVVAYPELGFTTFVLQGFVTMLPPMLAEVGALLWGRGSRAAALRMGDLTLQLVVGVTLTLLLNLLALQVKTS